ncbi:MAG TPA: glycosyltransferase, partial [Anaerolineae bacterium]
MLIVLILYSLTLLGLTIYLQRSVLVSIYAKVQKRTDLPDVAEANLPTITVQLPIYNEQYVARRVIEAACSLDYPRDRLQIQVLDDSTDDNTTDLIAQSVRRWQQAGITIVHCRRPTRHGQKAGNLAHALPSATGEFIAIFDADFVPNPAWLRHTVAHFFRAGSSRLGLVQTRWDYLNTYESWLTYAQMLTFEEFGLAQVARGRLGLFIS